MTTNKFSKYVIDNIVVGTPISSIVAAGAVVNGGLDSAAVIDLIDSDYVQQRESSGLDSAEVIELIDSDYVAARTPASNGSGLDSATTLDLLSYGIQNVGSNQKQVSISLNTFVDPFNQTGNDDRSFNLNYTSTTGMFVRETAGRTEIHADASGTGQSTGLLLTGASFGNNGTEIAGNLKIPDLPTSDPAETGLLWNDGGIPVFSGSTAPTTDGIDSADVEGIVDSAYVQARQTPQDFAYSSLTGAPTALSSFTNDTNYITAADIPATVDSDYVAARVPAVSGGLDSAGVQTLIDAEVQDPTTLTLGASSNAGIGIGSGVVTDGLSGGSVSIGTNANSYIQSVAIGSGADASGTGSVSVGPNTQASGNFNTAIGRQATTSGSNSLALGYSSSAGNYGIALGDAASGQRSIAVGALASAPATGALHINANYNSGVGPTADGGLVIETASARLEYSADSDWTFDATVNAPAFVGDGSGLTNLPAGGGLDSAAVEAMIDSDLAGVESNSFTVKIGTTADRIAIGKNAVSDRVNSISIGTSAGRYIDGGSGHVVIGDNAGGAAGGGQAHNIIAIGTNASTDISSAQFDTIAMGYNAGRTNMGNYAIAIGYSASTSAAGSESVALGASSNATGSRATAIGVSTDATGLFSVALGDEAQATARSAIAIGKEASATTDNSLSIGYGAGNTTGGDGAVLIGTNAGQSAHQRSFTVAVGMNAQLENDATTSATVAVGYDAGKTRQESSTVAVGYQAGQTDQLNSATAVGFKAGNTSQGGSSVAIGRDAAFTGQATNSVAIGRAAGYENQGTRSIAIGRQAGAANQGANNIILNATSGALDRTDQFGIDIRTSAAGSLTYDTTNDWTFGAGVTMTDLTASGATVIFSNLPIADPLNAGQLWNSAGTLKVSAG